MSIPQKQLQHAIGNLGEILEGVIAESNKVEEGREMAEVLINFYTLKEMYAQLDALRKKMYHRIDSMDKAVIPKMMDDQGVDKVAVPEIARSFYKLTKHSASMVDKDLAMQWLRDNELGDAITETVNAGTLAKMLKEYVLETGKDAPEEAFKLTEYSSTGSSKYTPK